MIELNATQFPEIYQWLGIDTSRLGCIMLNTEPLKVSDIVPADDLYYSDPVLHPHTQGVVSETVPHVTLLYGLLRSGLEYKPHVDSVMAGWKIKTVTIKEVNFFYGEDEKNEYITVIALVEPTPELVVGNGLLRFLPHIDTFMDYKPHITLAYIKNTADWQGHVEALNERFKGKEIKVLPGLNYGGNDVEV